MSTDVEVSKALVDSDEKVNGLRAALRVLQGSSVYAGQKYQHHETGKVYVIVATGLFEGSLEPMVHYQSTEADDQDRVLWTRPLEVFCGFVTKGGTLVPRFVRV